MKSASIGEIDFQPWPIPADKYIFIERWTNISPGPGSPRMSIDFPTYIFDRINGTLKPFIVPPGRWFPFEENLTDLKVVYGTGTGIQGNGAASGVSAITELPFTRDIVTIVKVDAQGVVYLKREAEQIVLRPGESWITSGKGNIPDSTSEERISNYGIFEKSKIQLYKE